MVFAVVVLVFVVCVIGAQVSHRYFGWPARPPLTQSNRSRSFGVTVFTHDEAVRANAAMPLTVRDVFISAGWKVSVGQTNLPIHSQGVWVHGGTPPEQAAATWALKAIGLDPKIDDRAGDTDLQVIVGALPTNAAVHKTLAPSPVIARKLMDFRKEGEGIKSRIRAIGSGAWKPELKNEARAWENKVSELIESEVPQFLGRFKNDIAIQQWQPGANARVANWGNFMDRRLVNLQSIIEMLHPVSNG
jgi:hypothetical protein